MATELKKCKHCGKYMLIKANTCLNCGKREDQKTTKQKIVISFVVAFSIFAFVNYTPSLLNWLAATSYKVSSVSDQRQNNMSKQSAATFNAGSNVTTIIKDDDGIESSGGEENIPSGQVEEDVGFSESKKSQYKAFLYKDLLRFPDKYVGEKAVFDGKVIWVHEYNDNWELLLATKDSGYGFYDDCIYVYAPKSSDGMRILEDDMLNVYGYIGELETYNTVGGGSETTPMLQCEYWEVKIETILQAQ